MGIQGLLPLLKSIMVPTHIKDLEGCCVAVDTYSWLHKGALSCSKDLCKGTPTSRHIEYCMHRVNLLQHHGVKPILVFDGGLLPMKIEQENKRARSRKENLGRAIEHESNGNSAAAYECYQKAVDISPSIAHELIQVLKQENISYIVAPYEADAQMTFLAVSKHVDAVITEDSDLIPFGCPRIIYKMDKFGQGVEFRQSMLQQNKDLSFAGFTQQMLLEMCILSGCDYLQSLTGMGLKRAHALIKKFKSYDKVIKHLRYSVATVPTLYEESFKKAILTFRHQRVYDPVTENIVHLSDVPEDVVNDLDFLGPLIPQQVAKGIATGDLDPFTQMPFQVENNNSIPVLDRNTCPKTLKPEKGRKTLDLPVQKNLLTKYFCFASLEAKRKFRAPRISPKPPSPTDHTVSSSKEHVILEAVSCELKCSSESLLDSKKLDNDSPGSSCMESGSASEGPEFSESLSHGRSTHETRQALAKEHDHMNVLDEVEGKITIDSKEVILRSSYFQHKQQDKNNQGYKQAKLLVKDHVAFNIPENVIPESFSFGNNSIRGTAVKSVVNERSSEDSYEPQQALLKEHDSTDIPEAVEGKTRTDNRRVIVRSSYFQNKQKNQNVQEKRQEKLLVKGDVAIDISENVIPEGMSSGNNSFEGTTMKRKTCPHTDIEMENVEPKLMRIDASPDDNGCCNADFNETSTETKTNGKFGSNISHLGQYSGIAEKSMERFVSMLSLFRCSSSGSRASGLRAPLKDVRNTCTNRPSAEVDFSQFAYVPNKGKAALKPRKH